MILRPLEEQTAIWASLHSRSQGFCRSSGGPYRGSMRDLVVKPHLTNATVPFACKAKCISFRCRSQADAKRGFGAPSTSLN